MHANAESVSSFPGPELGCRLALFALVALVFSAGRAEALALSAAVGGYDSITTASCDGIPPPVCFGCTATNSASCPGSVSTASASPMLELASYSSSTYSWQSNGASSYTETMSFDKPGLTGTDGTLLINFQITGETQLSGDDTIEDAAGGFDANTKSCDACGIIDSTGDFPIQLHGAAVVPLLIHFTHGNSFILSVSLTAGTFGRYPETVAISDFSHTAKIGSFEFRDQGGNLVSDVEVTTQFGINPFVPAPEPTASALAVTSLEVLFFMARGRWRRSIAVRAPRGLIRRWRERKTRVVRDAASSGGRSPTWCRFALLMMRK
jgi:hypothetical protein